MWKCEIKKAHQNWDSPQSNDPNIFRQRQGHGAAEGASDDKSVCAGDQTHVFITANNRKRRHPEKVVMLSVPGHFAKQSDVQHISFQTLFSLFSILIVVHVLDNNCYDCCSGFQYWSLWLLLPRFNILIVAQVFNVDCYDRCPCFTYGHCFDCCSGLDIDCYECCPGLRYWLLSLLHRFKILIVMIVA